MSNAAPHYLIITFGTTGDIYPFMRIAGALQKLGRKITFITSTYHAKLIQNAGFPFIGLGTEEDYLRIVQNPDLWNPAKGLSVLMTGYEEQLKQLDEAIQSVSSQARKIALVHPLALTGALISRERGFIQSIAVAYLAPSNIKTLHDPFFIGSLQMPRWVPISWRRAFWWLIGRIWVAPIVMPPINAAREAMDLPKMDSLWTQIEQQPDLSVTLFPSWYAAAAPDWPQPRIAGDFQLFEANSSETFTPELEEFLAAGEKPLVFTPGTGNRHAADLFACALSSINKIGQRAIFLSMEQAQIPVHLPDTVLWQPYVPLRKLLPHAAALVHHGGIGTIAEALRCGTPQLVTPFAWDQFDNGVRIAALGVGMTIPARRLHPRKLARGLQTLINSTSVRDCCTRWAGQFKSTDDTIALCKKIEELL